MPLQPGKMVQVDGIQTVIRAMERIRDSAVTAARAGLEAVGDNVLILAKYYCPVETGALRESGRVEVLDQFGTKPDQLRLQVIFGGKVGFEGGKGQKADSDFAGPAALAGQVVYYAVYVHENMTARHDPPTGAKFLERAVRENWQAVTELMGRHLELVIEANAAGDSRSVRSFGRMKVTTPAAPESRPIF